MDLETTIQFSISKDAKTSKNVIGSMSLTANLKELNLIDLERATNNFEEVLGRGWSGKVFKDKGMPNGRIIKPPNTEKCKRITALGSSAKNIDRGSSMPCILPHSKIDGHLS